MFPTDGERLLASTASEAAIGQRHVVQCWPCGTSRRRHIDQRWSGAPERACGTDTALGRSSRHGPGVFARQFMTLSSVWEIHIMSWGRSETILQRGVILPEMECCGFWPSRPGRAGGRGQSEHPIRVMTLLRGGPPSPRRGADKGPSGAFDPLISLCPASPPAQAGLRY